MINKIERKELLHIVTKLHKLFTTSDLLDKSELDFKLTQKIVKAFYRWYTCEGKTGLQRAKLCTNYFNRALLGDPLRSVPLSNQYKRLIDKALAICEGSSFLVKVYWVSIFSVPRLFLLVPEVDTTTITSGFNGRLIGLWRYFRSLRTTKESFCSAVNADQNWNATFKWHISGAAGPNGLVSYTQYLSDLRSLSHSGLGLNLVCLFLSLPYVNKWETVKALCDAFIDSLDKGDENACHSRLAFFPDKGGKTRVIALGDILTQSILSTVHQRCNRILRHLEQDGTFDQDQARCFIKKMSGLSEPLASIDLTAATDRMPALYQMWVLIYLRILNPLQGLLWYLVTTYRTFRYFDGKVEKRVRYAVGQPMGFLSSWPVMAISHHFIVRLSFSASGYEPENASYRVLGDDLTLLGFDVAQVYLDIISCLGMEYSPDKTYMSKGAAEFAKSLFCLGEDLTPFPLALLRFNHNTVVSNTLAIITECQRRKLPLTSKTLMELFPKRWRNLVLLAALSPLSPRYALDLRPRDDHWILHQFILASKVRYFSRLETIRQTTSLFAARDPGSSGKYLASPYLQIGRDNSACYPVRYLKDKSRLLDPEILLGFGWISYCTLCWPDGIPTIGDRNLIPGPTWKKERDNLFVRSSLLKIDKLLPNYFMVRCVGSQVGE